MAGSNRLHQEIPPIRAGRPRAAVVEHEGDEIQDLIARMSPMRQSMEDTSY
jgi:hypothetical protein